MLVYEGIKSEFIYDVNMNHITDKIYEKYRQYFGRTTESQINSWQNSMQYMRGVLSDNEIPDNAGIAIEFNIPTTSKRVDFIISGKRDNGESSVVIVELKQWKECTSVAEKDGIVNTRLGRGFRDTTHPSYQAASYANLIRDFNETVQNKDISIYPCAFLHNYDLTEDDPICSDLYKEYIDEAPLFGKRDFEKLSSFIKRYVKYGDNKETLYDIERGRIRPSKRLQDSLLSMLKGNDEFQMIDEQKVVYEEALVLARKAITNNTKSVLIVEGGPGTGKTVLAINLLVKMINDGFPVFYVTKNAAPRNVFSEKLKNKKGEKNRFSSTYINNVFKGSGSFCDAETNTVKCLIVDEAHRLNEKSGMYRNKGENQIKEIINAANFSVFFIDEDQRVTLEDIGSVNAIREFANQQHAAVKIMKLESQFRCNGSDGYLSWLDNTLQIRNTANFDYDFDYDFQVFDDPNVMREKIKELNNVNNKSRIVAGYCWNWIKEGRNDPNHKDIVIPEKNFEMSWNFENTSTWAIDEESINECGCIHTSQGLEFDYVGVIIGDDLRFENDEVITDITKRASTDHSVFGYKKRMQKNPKETKPLLDTIIRNTYRTLLTRGMKGCYVYCTDKALAEYLIEKSKPKYANH